ncbi:MAG TPA: SGNH/GDSL hydrolase family protein [Mycobacterium sp.]
MAMSLLQAHAAVADPHSDRAYTDHRALPDASLTDSLYTGSTPDVSTAQTTTPQAGFVKYAPAGVTLAGSDTTGPFTYAGAGDFQIGTVFPDTSYVLPLSKYPNTYASGQSAWSLEFGTDAQVFQLRMKYISTATMYRLSIDGRKVTDLMQSSNGITAGSGHLITFDLGSAAPRQIRFDFSTFPFGGVYVPPTSQIWGVPLRGRRAGVLGDSISDGSSGNTGGGAGTWVDRYARLMGYCDVWRQSRGGTGYITSGSFAVFQDRVAGDVAPWDFDELIIWGGFNDSTGSLSEIASAAALLYESVQSALPALDVIVVGCWSPGGTPSSGQANTNTTLRGAAQSAGLPFIDVQSGEVVDGSGTVIASQGKWITGTGDTGSPAGDGNADIYIGSDGIHPNDAGHVYLSRRMYAARTVLAAVLKGG